MRKSLQRRLARALLGFGIRIAPQQAAQWGQAMLGELDEVKGEWPALFWAVGGASVLLKHALMALVFPARNAPALLPNGGLFAKEASKRKMSLSIIGACIIASLLFLLAPTIRQGLGVCLAQWRTMSQVDMNWPPPASGALKALEKQAEEKHDAAALAFVAARIWNSAESTRLADEAVQLDPKLTWIYGAAIATPDASERWIQKLKEWDPQNALPYFMEAENIDNAQVRDYRVPHNVDEESAAWKNAMAAVFRASKVDTYRDQLTELNREIADRYELRDPYQIVSDRCFPCLPSYAAGDSSRYAKWELKSAELLETQGDLRGALAKDWAVIGFGEMTKGMLFTFDILKDAYEQVAAISQKRGDEEQAAFYRYLAGEMLRERNARIAEMRQRVAAGSPAMEWTADVMKVAGLLLPVCGAIFLVFVLTIVLKNRSLRPTSLRMGRGMAALGLGSAVGLFLSTVLLYVSYWPYAEMYREFLKTGNERHLDAIVTFLDFAQLPLGASPYSNLNLNFGMYQFYFWLTVIVLGGIALLVIAARHLHFRPRVGANT